MADNTSIPIIVQGNTFSLAIPLQIYVIDEDSFVLQDYTPDPTDVVTVQLKGSRRSYTYTPTIQDNDAFVVLTGNELADAYGVVVSIVKANGQRLRSFRTDQFFIVESSDDLTPQDIIEGLEENVIYLNSTAFIAGADGRGIESIAKTGTSGLVDTYTITYTDTTTSTFTVTNGAQGDDGVGITSIEKTSTSGLVDTYTITLSNGNTSTFDVTNGKDGYDLGLASIINNLTTGGTTDALSAEMGKELAGNKDVTRESTQSFAVESGGQHIYYPLTLRKDVKYTITLDISVNSESDLPSGYLQLKGVANGTTSNLTGQLWWKGTGKPTVYSQTIELTPTSDYSVLDVYQRTVVTACTIKMTILYTHNVGNGYVQQSFGKNLCDPTQIKSNYCVYQQEVTQPPYIRSNPSNNVTGYIPIKNGQTLVCNKVANSNSYNKCGLFASPEDDCVIDGTFTSGDTSLGYQTITNTLGYDAYAVFTIVSTATDVQVEVGNAPTGYEPFSLIGGYLGGVIDLQKRLLIMQSSLAVVKGVNHRGYNLIAPENTMPAFLLSAQNGFAYIETDVQFTSDNVAVLLHDTTINRTARNADGTAIGSTINIADITYTQALTYDFGIWKGDAFAGTTIPTLAEFLEFCRKAGVHPYLEIKSSLTNAEAESIVSIVNSCGMRGKVTYICNNELKLDAVVSVDANARIGFVCGTVDSAVIDKAIALKTATNEVFIDTSDTSTNAITLCKNAGVPLERWTIDTEADIIALDPYITGVTSDNINAPMVLYNTLNL